MTEQFEAQWKPSDVSAVVCTMNSVTSIEACLSSLRAAGVGEIIVVDAASSDGTRQIADSIADRVVEDAGIGLGNARNRGIAETTGALILNMGSDNIAPSGQLERMIQTLDKGDYQGVSARTRIEGTNYPSVGLNAWRQGRFRPGPVKVIGTPTLFVGTMLREYPYDPERKFSDDSELCERWSRDLGATFAISDAQFLELGKTSWQEVRVRARMYGISDHDVFTRGVQEGWSPARRVRSLLHPFLSDLVTPVLHVPPVQGAYAVPFLAAFTTLRYTSWLGSALTRTSDD